MIGLAPYSFNFDESRTYGENFRLLQYVIAFDDVHNFWLPVDQYKNLFRQEYLNIRLPLDSQIDCITPLSKNVRYIEFGSRITARERIDKWRDRNFPETKSENIRILDEYLTLCEKNNVRPVIFMVPLTEGYIKHFSKQKLEECHYLILDAQRKHPSAVFFDGWKLPVFPDIDFFDTDHLNINGAAKFSAILNGVIEELERMS